MTQRARRANSTEASTKICPRCGRSFAWRKKWASVWDSVVYCSAACRKTRLTATDAALEAAIIELLQDRTEGASSCPSEAARLVGEHSGVDWRTLLEPARRATRRLVAQRVVEITQGGRVVDPSNAKGPIRIRRAR